MGRKLLSEFFRHPKRGVLSARPSPHAAASLVSVKSHPRDHGFFRFRVVRFLYFFFLLVLAVRLSIEFENYARDISAVPRENLPLKLQSSIVFFGAGKLELKKAGYPLGESKGYPFQGKYDNVNWTKEVQVKEIIPVVFTGHFPNARVHPQIHVLKQAKKYNSLVYILGSPSNSHRLLSIGVQIEEKEKFSRVSNWVKKKFNFDKIDTVRWWWIKDFMERHNYSKVFYANPYGMLFANVSEAMTWMYPETDIALPLRWPSMQPPLLPNQYVTTSLSVPFAYITYDGLKDMLDFWDAVWDIDLFGVRKKAKQSIQLTDTSPSPRPPFFKEYTDTIVFGWYAYSECWTNPNLNPPCMAENNVGISEALARKIRGKFVPKFRVHSLCQPRKCQATKWSDEGLCAFDYSFSVLSPLRVFKYDIQTDKCPTSKFYEFYEIWMGKRQETPVQFLGLHFLGKRKEYLNSEVINSVRTFGASRN